MYSNWYWDVCHRVPSLGTHHYSDVIMGTMTSQITSLTIVYSTVYSGADQRKHQSSASLAFVWGVNRGPVNSPHKWPVTRKMFPFDDVIMMVLGWFLFPLFPQWVSVTLALAPCNLNSFRVVQDNYNDSIETSHYMPLVGVIHVWWLESSRKGSLSRLLFYVWTNHLACWSHANIWWQMAYVHRAWRWYLENTEPNRSNGMGEILVECADVKTLGDPSEKPSLSIHLVRVPCSRK